MATDPFLSSNPMVAATEAHRAKVEQTRENSARLAQAYITITTTGDGEFQIPDAALFGCTFTEQPIVATGFSLDGLQLAEGHFPRCHAFVRSWVQDDRGFYLGAFIALVVETSLIVAGAPDPAPTADSNANTGVVDPIIPVYVIDHDLTFTGIALKDLPDYLLDA